MVSTNRRSGGMFHDEVEQGRGGEQLATLHSSTSSMYSCERHTTVFSYGSLPSSAGNAQTSSCRTPRPLRRHNARASRRPSASGVSFAGAVQRTQNERLTRRGMFGTMAGGENPGPGRPEKNWAQCLVDDLRVFRATEGSTESVLLVFGVCLLYTSPSPRD